MALCTFIIHLFGDWRSPAIVGHVSDLTSSLQKGVLMLPAVLLVGAVLWLLGMMGRAVGGRRHYY